MGKINFIYKTRKSIRSAKVWTFFTAIALLLSMYFTLHYIVDYIVVIQKTIEIESAEQLKTLKSGTSVSFTTKDYGFMGIADEESGNFVAGYYAAILDNDVLVIRCKENYTADAKGTTRTFKGQLEKDSHRDDHITALVEMGLEKDVAEASLYRMYITDDNTYFRINCVFLIMLILGLLCLFLNCRQKLKNNKKAYEVFCTLGDTEINQRNFINDYYETKSYKWKKYAITPNWLYSKSSYNPCLIPLTHLVWAYKNINGTTINGIPTAKQFFITAYFEDDYKVVLRTDKTNADAIIELLRNAAPWAIFGYTKELETTWKHNKSELIDTVKNRLKMSEM